MRTACLSFAGNSSPPAAPDELWFLAGREPERHPSRGELQQTRPIRTDVAHDRRGSGKSRSRSEEALKMKGRVMFSLTRLVGGPDAAPAPPQRYPPQGEPRPAAAAPRSPRETAPLPAAPTTAAAPPAANHAVPPAGPTRPQAPLAFGGDASNRRRSAPDPLPGGARSRWKTHHELTEGFPRLLFNPAPQGCSTHVRHADEVAQGCGPGI